MSGSAGAAAAATPAAALGLGLDVGGGVVRKRGTLVQTYLLTGSVHPPPPPTAGGGTAGSKAPLRLPSLGATTGRGPRRRSSMARLSLSEPSLLNLNESVRFDGVSGICRSGGLHKRPPPPPLPPPPFSKSSARLPCRAWLPPGCSQQNQQPHRQQNQPSVQGCSRRAYIHFSQVIQPGIRPRPARRHSHNPTPSVETGDLRPLSSTRSEPLSVIGKPCLPSCGQRPTPAAAAAAAAGGPARAQLHVFLPTETEGEEGDSESVDEGFMDELDGKITSLKLQQRAPKTVTYH